MNHARCALARRLPCAALLCSSVLCIQAFADTSLESDAAYLQLPRLVRKSENQKKIRDGAYEAVPLRPGQGAKQRIRNEVGYIEVEPTALWSQKLRQQNGGANYVTIALTASSGTCIEVGGASIIVEQSQRHPSYAAIHVADVSVEGGHETPWLLFGGARMALLDRLTIMVDRRSNTWAMWIQDSLVFAGLPLAAMSGNGNEIQINGGKAGAWVSGIVCSDENPFFKDDNDNTVPDDFEMEALGMLLDRQAPNETLNALRRAWFADGASRRPSSFKFCGLLPDRFPDACSPDGEPVHGMLDGLKFGAPRTN